MGYLLGYYSDGGYFKDRPLNPVQARVRGVRIHRDELVQSVTGRCKCFCWRGTFLLGCVTPCTSGSYGLIFGTGTKLFVTDTPVKTPKMYLFPPTSEDLETKDTFFMVCLMTDFFPDVIKVEWKIEDSTNTQRRELTDSVKKIKEGSYSLISRLEISKADWTGHKISCQAKHQQSNPEVSYDKKSAADVPKTDDQKDPDCQSSEQESQESMDEGPLPSSLRVATLTYTILLMKSVLYCGIISFIVYKVEYRGTKKSL